MSTNASPTRDYKTITWRCLRLRCPACGEGRVLKDWFRTADECETCGYDLIREPGFYLGSIYVNYGLTAALLLAVCMPLVLFTEVPYAWITPGALLFCLLFPIWFHRYARAFWLGFDYRWDGFRAVDQRTQTSASTRTETVAEDEASPESASRAPSGGLGACPFCHHRGRYDERLVGSWVDCEKCGQQMLLTAGGPPPSE